MQIKTWVNSDRFPLRVPAYQMCTFLSQIKSIWLSEF